MRRAGPGVWLAVGLMLVLTDGLAWAQPAEQSATILVTNFVIRAISPAALAP